MFIRRGCLIVRIGVRIRVVLGPVTLFFFVGIIELITSIFFAILISILHFCTNFT